MNNALPLDLPLFYTAPVPQKGAAEMKLKKRALKHKDDGIRDDARDKENTGTEAALSSS